MAYSEALAIQRELAKENPTRYHTDIAGTLINLGVLLYSTKRMNEAELVYSEALGIYQDLAKTDQTTTIHLVEGAKLLNNLALIYSATQRTKDAERAFSVSVGVLRNLNTVNRGIYGDYLTRTLVGLALTLPTSDSTRCTLIREALEVAVSAKMKELAISVQQKACEAANSTESAVPKLR